MRTTAARTAAALAALAAATAVPTPVPAAEPVRDVVLENGETFRALVVPASYCPVIVQTDQWCLEVPLSRIRSIDGSRDVAAVLRDTDRPPLLRQETLEELGADGSVRLQSSFARTNLGAEPRLELSWGLAPHEVEWLDRWTVHDEFGNALPMRRADRADGSPGVVVPLRRPILPGETVRFTSTILFPDRLRRDGDAWVYRNEGDYPDDRLVSRTLRLPAGAEILATVPEDAQVLETDDRTFVHWRRYFAAGERTPFEVRFRVAVGDY